jgi:serine O-acetyltransferase
MLVRFVSLRATLVYRLSRMMHVKGFRMLPQALARWNIVHYGLDIPPSVPIGPRLHIPHTVGTTVMARRIGSDCTLVSCVTIGMRDEHEFPIIGDNVYIGAGARVLGAIRVGDNVKIGANAVVMKDVPDGCTAVGVPARILPPRTAEGGPEPTNKNDTP